jgi:hypothetical protein
LTKVLPSIFVTGKLIGMFATFEAPAPAPYGAPWSFDFFAQFSIVKFDNLNFS